MLLIILFAIIAFFITGYLLFVNLYSGFGGRINKALQKKYINSQQFENGKFVNKNRTVPKRNSFKETLKIGYKFFTTKTENGRPKKDIKPIKLNTAEVANYNSPKARLFWYGHSAFLLQINGKNLLLDPMFGKVPSPLKFLGEKRFNSELPLSIKKLPKIDAVIISHDHYDHLDYVSILKLKEKTEHFFTPLGVGVHLEKWGIKPSQITELDWWQEHEFKNLKLVCTPSQHFSGRKLETGQSTLWCSWVIVSPNEKLFFSGDSGYAEHFKKIGEKYGEFDLALMECGQYNKMWSDIHMTPEQTAQAGKELNAKKIMPIHWGGFKLAMHDWREPILRVSKKAKELDLPIITPQIGEEIIIQNNIKTYEKWWEKY